MTRTRPPARRHALTQPIDHMGQRFIVSFGFDSSWNLCEVFAGGLDCAATPLVALAQDACILLSRLLQHGESIEELALALGEDRAERAEVGPPSSLIGAIARKGQVLSKEILTWYSIESQPHIS